MRIGIAANGSRGDVHPMLALAERLRAEGYEVVFCAPPNFRAAVEVRGCTFHPVGRSIEDFLRENALDITAGPRRSLQALNRWIAEILEDGLTHYPTLLAGVDRVVGVAALAGPSVAELLNVPYRLCVYCPAVLYSSTHAPALFPIQSLPRWSYGLAWRIARVAYNGWLRRALNTGRARLGLPAVKDFYLHFMTEQPILACDAELAGIPGDSQPRPLQVGYAIPNDDSVLSADTERFLAAGPPPVYVGFGSMSDRDPDATTRLIVEALARSGRRGVISQGWAGLGGAGLPAEILNIGPVDHRKLFPRMAAVVHHGGAGTTATAARAGVPQVFIPHLADQFFWARSAERLGLAGAPVLRHKLTAERLTQALDRVLSEGAMQSASRSLADRLRAGDPVGALVKAVLA